MVIGDITRAFHGTETRFVELLLQRARATGSPGVVIFHNRQQKQIGQPADLQLNLQNHPQQRQGGTPADLQPVALSDWSTPEEIAAAIRERVVMPALLKSQTEHLEIYSFFYSVLNLSSTIPPEARMRISTSHWKYLNFDGTLQEPIGGRPTSSNVVSTAATDILFEVLRRHPRGLQQSALRQVLSGTSPIFDKSSGGPPIGAVVRAARLRGLVEVTPPGHFNPVVRAVISIPSEAAPDAIGVSSESPTTPVQPTDEAANIDRRSGEDKLSGAPEVASSPTTDAASATTEAEAEESRVEKLYAHFNLGGLGPFPSLRNSWFDRVEEAVSEKKFYGNRIIKKIARDVVSAGTKLPFVAVERFLFELMRRRPVFLDEQGNERDPRAASSFAVVITSLKENWRALLEAEMLLYLATIPGGLSMDELDQVGFVMYPGLEADERQARVEQLYALLRAEDRISTDRGRIIVLAKPEALPAPITVMPKPTGTGDSQRLA